MNNIKLKFKKIDDRAVLPSYGSFFSAGADLHVCLDESVIISPGETFMFHIGICVEIPEGFAGFVFSRSGLATKKGLALANKVGVIDSDYRGELMVPLFNQSSEPQCVEVGERIAQIVFMPYAKAEFAESVSLSDSERGEGGFGSTGRS